MMIEEISLSLKNIEALENFRHAFKSIDTPYFSILSDDDFLARNFTKMQ